ncbi:hypothetical protein STZ1_40001 [Bacillus subtilis]
MIMFEFSHLLSTYSVISNMDGRFDGRDFKTVVKPHEKIFNVFIFS